MAIIRPNQIQAHKIGAVSEADPVTGERTLDIAGMLSGVTLPASASVPAVGDYWVSPSEGSSYVMPGSSFAQDDNPVEQAAAPPPVVHEEAAPEPEAEEAEEPPVRGAGARPVRPPVKPVPPRR